MKINVRDFRCAAMVAALSFAVCWASNNWVFDDTASARDPDYWMEKQLDLTRQQKEALREVEQRFQERRQELRATIQAANAELAEAILADGRYSERVAAANAKIHAAQGELKKATLEHFFEMQPMLDDAQRAKMNRIAADALYHNH